MKKLVSVFLALVLLCSCSVAFARNKDEIRTLNSLADAFQEALESAFPGVVTASYISEADILLITLLMEDIEPSIMRRIYDASTDEKRASVDNVMSTYYETACKGLKVAEAEDVTVIISMCCNDNKIGIMTINGEFANDFLKN